MRQCRGVFAVPPETELEGNERRVGVEIEYQGPRPRPAAERVRETVGGDITEKSPFELEISGGQHGTFRVEVDARFLKNREYLQLLENMGVDVRDTPLQQPLEDWLGKVSSAIVPQELITPPLPLSALPVVDELREALRLMGARGTRDSMVYAFGVHFNPEIWSRDVRVVRNVLQSFLLLYDGLVATMDLSRRIGPFVSDFPEPYRKLVLDPDYDPDLEGFVRDYVDHNPTRNRSLDLLPLLTDLLPAGPWDRLEEPELVNARPAFHYRLPDSRIDDPGWTIAEVWAPWVRIETWAVRRDELEALIEAYRENAREHPWNYRWRWRDHAAEALSG